MSLSMSEKIDALYAKFVSSTDAPTSPPTPPAPSSASSFMPSAAAIAAFAARFGTSAAWLMGDAPEQAAVTAQDPGLELAWPRIPALPTPLVLADVQEYASMGYRPDGTHAKGSKAAFANCRRLVALFAAPEVDTAAKADAIITGAGSAEPAAVAMSLLTGLVAFPSFQSPHYPGYVTPADVVAALTALPAPAEPFDPSKPGPGIAR
jgi:hypothetical protein